MIQVYNIRDSYTWYRKNLLKERFKFILEVANKSGHAPAVDSTSYKELRRLRTVNVDNYKRLPIKLIEGYEKHYNIVPEIKDPGMTIYISIVHGYLKFLIGKLIEGHDIVLGARLGKMGIRGKKVIPIINEQTGNINGLAPSWGKTRASWTEKATELGLTFKEYVKNIPKEQRKIIFCLNEHSDFIRYRMVWHRDEVIVKNKTFYNFNFTQHNRDKVFEAVHNGKEYLVIEK